MSENMFSPQHGSRIYDRSDGRSADQRRMTFGSVVDKFFPWAIAALLVWLCTGQSALQNQMAVLIERTGAQTKAMEAEREDRRTADAYLQKEIEDMKGRK